MSTRVLIILSLLFIVVAGYFYASNDAELTTPNLMPSDIDYQASRIKALQTNDQGTVSYQLTADISSGRRVCKSNRIERCRLIDRLKTFPNRRRGRSRVIERRAQIVSIGLEHHVSRIPVDAD